MKIFKDKWFSRFARQNDISDGDLCEAIDRAERGLIDGPLGGGVIKQRIARPNEGRSGGFRSIIYFRSEERAVFVFGFAKNELDNISPDALKYHKQAAQIILALDEAAMQLLITTEKLFEVSCNDQDLQE